MLVESDRAFDLPAGRDEVWEALGRVDAYRSWWPWLTDFDAAGLVTGDRWECVIRPPLPYELRVQIGLDDVDPGRAIVASVKGDISGRATITLEDRPGGCQIRLQSSLHPERGLLRTVSRLAPWLARFGHDWILESGHRQFTDRAL